ERFEAVLSEWAGLEFRIITIAFSIEDEYDALEVAEESWYPFFARLRTRVAGHWLILHDWKPRLDTWASHLPDNAYTLTMEGVLMLVKLVLHGALKGLPGLQCMYPRGDYLKRLNASQPNASQYFVIGADFTPTSEALLARFAKRVADKLIDGVFGEENDGVVPTRGGSESEAHTSGFPIKPEQRVVFTKSDEVHHCNYFGKERTQSQILEWVARKITE